MTYSAALFDADGDDDLHRAQMRKYDRILDRLGGRERVLEIGCGWGGFAERAADRGHAVTGVTISPSQKAYADARLDGRADIRLQRLPRHLGPLRRHRLDRDDRGGRRALLAGLLRDAEGSGWPRHGRAVLQAITVPDGYFPDYRRTTDYIRHSTFPGGMLLCDSAIAKRAARGRAEGREPFAFGADYARTCRHVGREPRRAARPAGARSATAARPCGTGSTTSRPARPASPWGAPTWCRSTCRMPDAVAVNTPHARKGSLLMKLVLILALAALAIVLVQRVAFSFMAQRPADYAGTTPAFDVRTNLGGPMVSEGIIYGPTGRVTTRFVADMNGVWRDDGTATLGESFRYASGGTQEREWRITMRPDGNFTATADDIIGEAVGELSGATLRMRYRIRLPESGGGWEMDVTDWLYLAEDGVILNRSQFRRFGIKLAELVATIRPAAQ